MSSQEQTLTLLNTHEPWDEKNNAVSLKYIDDEWKFVCDNDIQLGLDIYCDLESDIVSAWKATYPTLQFPVAAYDSDSIRDPGIFLMCAEGSLTMKMYFFYEEEGNEEGSEEEGNEEEGEEEKKTKAIDGKITEYYVFGRPIAIRMRILRQYIRCTMKFMALFQRSKDRLYKPGGFGFKRARDEFESIATSFC